MLKVKSIHVHNLSLALHVSFNKQPSKEKLETLELDRKSIVGNQNILWPYIISLFYWKNFNECIEYVNEWLIIGILIKWWFF